MEETDFNKHFFNVRDHEPEKGQVIARFRAICQLLPGDEKRFLVKTLQRPDSSHSVVNIMSKLFYADHESSFQIPQQMAKDLLDGMSEEEVINKEQEYTAEFYYYVKPQYVPQDDSHWEIINIL